MAKDIKIYLMVVVGPAAGGHIMFVTWHTYNLHTMQQQFEDAHVVCFSIHVEGGMLAH